MKNFDFTVLLFIGLFLGACTENKVKEKISKDEIAETSSIEFNNKNLDTLAGIYSGDFGGSDIRIIITHIGKNHVVGYNVHKGLRRNISGNYINKGDTILMTLSEPGDNQFDGVFNLEIYLSNFKGKGKWKSNSGKVSNKLFQLEKLPPFEYVEDIGKLNNSNFTSTYSWVEDSLGSILFDEDGSCKYEFYPNIDSKNRVEQKTEIKGSWTIVNNNVKINWQANSIFPKRLSLFKLIKEEYTYSLNGEGRIMYSNNF